MEELLRKAGAEISVMVVSRSTIVPPCGNSRPEVDLNDKSLGNSIQDNWSRFMSEDEVLRREAMARAAIKQSLGTAEAEASADLFASYHLEELEEEYWQKHLGTRIPEPIRIFDILELRSHWGDGDDNGLDVFDFTLPGDVTDYVISVRFDETGDIEDISMEI